MKQLLTLEVNGEVYETAADTRDTLLQLLRYGLGLTGTKEGCSNGNCGSCTVLLEGEPVCACLMLAVEADRARVTTIEGVASRDALHPVQTAMIEAGGTQCGFCTPGMVLSVVALLSRKPDPSEADIRHAIAGNICRCTGYGKIVDAVKLAVAKVKEPA